MGIIWRSFDDTTTLLNDSPCPVLVFVVDYDGMQWPFLREVFRALPQNEKLCKLLNGPCAPMLLQADALPDQMAALGAGSTYHIAVVSPAGLTTMVRFNHVTSKPEELAEEVANVLERLAPIWA